MHKQFSGVLCLSHLYTEIENDVIPMRLFVKYKYAQKHGLSELNAIE